MSEVRRGDRRPLWRLRRKIHGRWGDASDSKSGFVNELCAILPREAGRTGFRRGQPISTRAPCSAINIAPFSYSVRSPAPHRCVYRSRHNRCDEVRKYAIARTGVFLCCTNGYSRFRAKRIGSPPDVVRAKGKMLQKLKRPGRPLVSPNHTTAEALSRAHSLSGDALMGATARTINRLCSHEGRQVPRGF